MAVRDDEESRVLTTTLTSLLKYEHTALHNLVEPRRKKYEHLAPQYKQLVPDFLKQIDEIEEGIKDNAFFLSHVAQVAAMNFGAPEDSSTWSDCQPEDVQKVGSTLRQVAREWSTDGEAERSICFGKIIVELLQRYPDLKERHGIKILVPGSGLGRLPMELALMGFKSEGNEFSYHMLFTSSMILNHTSGRNEFRIHPFLNTFSHLRTKTDQTREVLIPDVSPHILTQQMVNDPDIPEEGLMSMTSGSFDMIYPPEDGSKFDVITTVYFLDTAANIFNTLQTIHDTLKPGGLWLNFGPLLWHYEDIMPIHGQVSQDSSNLDEDRSCGFEFALDDLISLIEKFGFKFEKRESGIPSSYTSPRTALGGYSYLCEFWVCTKV